MYIYSFRLKWTLSDSSGGQPVMPSVPSIAVSLFVDTFVKFDKYRAHYLLIFLSSLTNTESETNPNNNLTHQRVSQSCLLYSCHLITVIVIFMLIACTTRGFVPFQIISPQISAQILTPIHQRVSQSLSSLLLSPYHTLCIFLAVTSTTRGFLSCQVKL